MSSAVTRILLVEDNPADARVIHDILKKSEDLRVSITCLSDLQSAMQHLRETAIDVVILDLLLPDAQGVEMIKVIRGVAPAVPVVVLTGWDDDTIGLQALREGAQDYLVKSRITPALVSRAVRYAIERQHCEREIQKAYAEIEQLLSAISSILVSVNADGIITRWNDAAAKAFGAPTAEVVGRPFEKSPIRWNYTTVLRIVERSLKNQERDGRHELPYTTPDGKEGIMGFTVNPIEQAGKARGFLLLMKDVTNIKVMESQLTQAQKLESIGQLAAGIAHEINTPIQYVNDNIRFFRESFTELVDLLEVFKSLHAAVTSGADVGRQAAATKDAIDHIDLEYLLEEIPNAIEQSLEGVDRVRRIVRAMKNFSHPGGAEKVAVDLHKQIENTIIVSRNEWKYVAEIDRSFDPEIPPVPCYPDDFNQVILNLIVNAAHSIADALEKAGGGQGTITISTKMIDPWVEIRVGDTGLGIPESIRSRIFEPFFTTKKLGRGTGQGLSMAYATIVNKHHGEITFESELNKGTTFIIRLPLTTKSFIRREKDAPAAATVR